MTYILRLIHNQSGQTKNGLTFEKKEDFVKAFSEESSAYVVTGEEYAISRGYASLAALVAADDGDEEFLEALEDSPDGNVTVFQTNVDAEYKPGSIGLEDKVSFCLRCIGESHGGYAVLEKV